MRQDTRTFQAVIDGSAAVVDPNIASKSSNGLDVSVCARCSDTIFSPVTWAHLRGDTLDQPIPADDGDKADYHIMDDFDFVVKMFNARPNPKKRGPMVDFKVLSKEISESSSKPCGFCKLLTLLGQDGDLLKEADEKIVLRLQAFWPEKANGSMHPMMLEVGMHPSISGGGQVWPMFFYEEPHAELSDSSEDLAQSVNHETYTDLLRQAAAWLWTCEHTHDKCSHIETQRSPTRLLDLIHFRDQKCVRLTEPTDVTNGQYAMLSYVWGSLESFRLDGTTHSEFESGISVDRLPRTIREAILVTDALRIRYLWIDALCILQDSVIDKEHEIPRMCEYYKNALVVISASGASDVHSGFLFEQDSPHDVFERLQNVDPLRQGVIGPVPLRIPGHFPDYSTSLLVELIPIMYTYKREPINNRAWTLQESILPRRLLTFPMTGGLFMRCLEGESLAGEIVSDPYHEVPPSNSLGIVSSSERTGDELLELWTKMVEDYTQRSLSYRSDILIAIGALAREFYTKHNLLLGRYLGGLWENHIRSGLLWYNTRDTPEPQRDQRSHYVAPSWSWASCPHPVVIGSKPEMILPWGEATGSPAWIEFNTPRWYCQILSSDVTPQSELDPFGALKSGFLTIQAPLRPLQRHTDKSEGDAESEFKSQGCPNLYLKEAGRPAEALILDRPLVIPDHTGSEEPQYYWLGIWHAGRGRARGLIVHQIDETSFERLGYAVYPINREEFPSSELHKERIIQLV